MSRIDHIAGQTFHGRKGTVENAFTYSVDYVLFNAESDLKTPALFSRNGRNLTSLHDSDHGGAPKAGRGVAWVRQVLDAHGLNAHVSRIELLAQPRVLGHVFNPVSFWLGYDGAGDLRVVIPEVTNTFGDRHSYLCAHPDHRPITAQDTLQARKIFHVSPFQPVRGDYRFRFDITQDRVGIWINYDPGDGEGALLATLTGKRQALSNATIVKACLRRPFGSRRVLTLIHWQALKLWAKGAVYRPRPEPPLEEISR